MSDTPGLFITGTGTNVGKTYVAAMIARSLVAAGLRVGIYKPVASDCRPSANGPICADAVALWDAAGKPGSLEAVCPQRFLAPLAPHLAARAEGREVDADLLRTGIEPWLATSDIVLVEGAGGLLSPVTDDEYVADLAADFGFPLVIIALDALGTIHHTLSTLAAAASFRSELAVAGIILNELPGSSSDPSIATNRAELTSRAVPPVLAKVPPRAQNFSDPIDWLALATPPGTPIS